MNDPIRERAEKLYHSFDWCETAGEHITAIESALRQVRAEALESARFACLHVSPSYAGQSLHDACVDAIDKLKGPAS